VPLWLRYATCRAITYDSIMVIAARIRPARPAGNTIGHGLRKRAPTVNNLRPPGPGANDGKTAPAKPIFSDAGRRTFCGRRTPSPRNPP
jgi:hypothetical protein